MTFPGFIGPAYSSRSIDVAGDRLVNLFLEQVEDAGGKKGPACLYGTPGTRVFVTLPQLPVRGLINANGRVFAVGGLKLYEISAAGVATERAHLGATAPIRMAFNGYQIFIASGSDGWVYNVNDNTFSSHPNFLGGEISGLAFADTYFLASRRDSREYGYSEINEGKTWPGDSRVIKEGAGDNIVTIFADHRELWVFGSSTSEVHFNSGASDGPWGRIQGAFIEAGCAAADSPAKFDNSIIWLGADERGNGFVWRANGYNPQRVSTHAMEHAIQSYSRIDDAVGFTYQEQGHVFYVLTFPTAEKTWAIDAATNSWHEREYWDSVHAVARAIRGRTYCYGHGKHLVGDFETGAVYEMSMAIADDNGTEIRRIRRAPAVWSGDKVMTTNRLSIIMQTGTADSSPTAFIRTSNDGGYTWSSEIEASMGQLGSYGRRVQFRRLGSARRKVIEFRVTDRVPVAIASAEIDVQEGS